MLEQELLAAAAALAAVGLRMDDADLERDWAWGAYNEEGIRFAFFRTYEQLREMATCNATARDARGQPPSTAQRILAQHHAAYRDLEGALLGLDEAAVNQAPAEGDWTIRETVAHVAGAEAGFYGAVAFALARSRGGLEPAEVPDEAWDDLLGHDEETFTAVMEGPTAGIRDYFAAIHDRTLAEFAGISDAELSVPSFYWEGYALSLRFRLHRLDSHLRQHTVQVDKTRLDIGRPPREVDRLMRLVYAALAEAEASTIGAWDADTEKRRQLADEIEVRAAEIGEMLQ